MVEHKKNAYSPTIEWMEDERPWYMHPFQIDNLIVFKGTRIIDLYARDHMQIETFEVSPRIIKHNWKIIYEWKAIFWRYTKVFHRVHSPQWSISLNLAQHLDGFDIKTNFNIYNLNLNTCKTSLLREWHLDQ